MPSGGGTIGVRGATLLASAIGWCWLAVDAARLVPSICLSGDGLAQVYGGFSALLASGQWLDEAILWGVMVVATMLPLQVPALRHVVLRSFRRRRAQAVAAFLAGYGAAWGVAGLAVVPLLAALSMAGLRDLPLTGAAALVAAAAWQFLPVRATAMRRCHRTAAVGAYGWRADRDCAIYGWHQGVTCLASCLPLMLALMVAFPGLPALFAVSALLYLERGYQQDFGPRSAALLLIGASGLGAAAYL